MKEFLFSLIAAGLCAALSVWLLLWADAKLDISSELCFPWIIDTIHGYGLSVKKVLFFTLYAVYLITGLHKLLGRAVLQLIGWAVFILIAAVVIIAIVFFVQWLLGIVQGM